MMMGITLDSEVERWEMGVENHPHNDGNNNDPSSHVQSYAPKILANPLSESESESAFFLFLYWTRVMAVSPCCGDFFFFSEAWPEMEYGSGGGGGGGSGGSGGDPDGSDSRRKKRYHRHTAHQIQRLEG